MLLHSSMALPDSKFMGSLELYLAVISLATRRVLDIKGLVLGIPYVDRTEPGTDEMLGLLLDRLPIRLQLVEEINPADKIDMNGLLSLTREMIKAALTNALPCHQIINMVSSKSLFDIIVV